MKYNFVKYHPKFLVHVKRHLPGSKIPGSVFTSNGFKDPRSIADKAYEKIENKYRGERIVFIAKFDYNIGLEGIIAIKDIPKGTTIKREIRVKKEQGRKRANSYTINVAYGLKMIPTNRMTIIAEPIKGENIHVLDSVFPGGYAPDFDDKKFWNEHAFINPKKL